jgi:hypothetical protein
MGDKKEQGFSLVTHHLSPITYYLRLFFVAAFITFISRPENFFA